MTLMSYSHSGQILFQYWNLVSVCSNSASSYGTWVGTLHPYVETCLATLSVRVLNIGCRHNKPLCQTLCICCVLLLLLLNIFVHFFRSVDEACSSTISLPFGYTSVCKQKYLKKKLLSLDIDGRGLSEENFFVPSCCVCELVRSTK